MLGLVMDDYLQSFEVRLNTSFLLHLLRLERTFRKVKLLHSYRTSLEKQASVE